MKTLRRKAVNLDISIANDRFVVIVERSETKQKVVGVDAYEVFVKSAPAFRADAIGVTISSRAPCFGDLIAGIQLEPPHVGS